MDKKINSITGIIFDYGGTIDTNGHHWAKVLWHTYQQLQIPIDKDSFQKAYVYGERTLAKEPLVKPTYNFHDVLRIKTQIQTSYLIQERKLEDTEVKKRNYAENIADNCYQYVLEVLTHTRPVIQALSEKYKLVLVSNFYGNIQTVLQDFGLKSFFSDVIESSVVGVRKPDPAIFRLGVKAMNMPASHILVVGDSLSKDIIPAQKAGCKTAWLKGEGWDNEQPDESLPDFIFSDISELPTYLTTHRV